MKEGEKNRRGQEENCEMGRERENKMKKGEENRRGQKENYDKGGE